jgi:hypothetical protein
VAVVAVVMGLLFGAMLVGVAAACKCEDRDGCGNALSCSGKNSDDACSPPKGGTCKAISGASGPLTCCCGCRRGNANSAACTGYPEVKAGLADLKEQGAACGKAAKAATRATASAAATTLKQGEKACQKNQEAKENAKVTATNKKFDKLDDKLEKLFTRNKVTQACRDNLRALAQDLIIETTNAGSGTEPTPSTTTTTTLPNPPNISCDGSFTYYMPNPAEVDYLLSCLGTGPSPFDGFAIVVNGREITNFLDPPGYTCMYQSVVTPNDSRFCAGPFPFNTIVSGGRLHFMPPPASGMGGLLRMYTNGSVAATYNITGP